MLSHLPRADSSTSSLDRSIFYIRGVWLILLLPCFVEIPVFTANSVDPDQTSSAASDLGLHCLQMSIYGTLEINGL